VDIWSMETLRTTTYKELPQSTTDGR
jgi:hypothetical protein